MALARNIFTTEEIAQISGLARVSVTWNIQQGKLKGEKIGGRWLVTAADLEEWLREREGNPQ